MAHQFEKQGLVEALTPTYAHRRTVRFQDVDAAGVIFFARILEYMHDAYVDLLTTHGCDLPKLLDDGSWIAPITHAEADFLSPARFGDELDIGIVCSHLRESDVVLCYRINQLTTGDVVAVGQTTHVFIDRVSRKRVVIPASLGDIFRSLGAE